MVKLSKDEINYPGPQLGRGPDKTKTEGTQAIRRATTMLREVAQHGARGVVLAELARSQELARSTAHRILKCLLDEGLLEFNASEKRYRIGHLLHELGMVPSSSAMEVARWSPLIEAVAHRCGVTSYLMRRSGLEAVCLVKVDGGATLRFVPVEVGQRRLLGVGGGATALLAALPDEQIEDAIRLIAPGLQSYPRITPGRLRIAVEDTHRTGFAISRGAVVKQGFGMAAIIPHAPGPHLAVSIAAYGSDVSDSTIEGWKRILREEIERFV
ncbi:helix-turn-helix domain-containing protein [Alcaligenaceae bacterium]|nr:helix-turn-helix domain-containing protein [Alcaligenaceae bacterium]